MFKRLKTRLIEFRDDQQGAIAITFGLCAVVVFLIAGLAIDMSRAMQASGRVTAALDAAALAGAKGLRLQGLSASEAKALAERVFQENMKDTSADQAEVKKIDVKVDTNKSEVTVNSVAEVPAFFGGVIGVNTFTVDRSSVAIFEAEDIEIALQLDVTGSMGGQKITDLKAAVKLLIDVVMPKGPSAQKVRVAIAPYSSGVNAGSYAAAVTDGQSVSAGSNCTFERLALGLQDTDTAPVGNERLTTVTDLPASANQKSCPSAEVQPLTDDETVLTTLVSSLSAGGYTAGHLGTAWAYYLLSPNFGTVFPADNRPVSYAKTSTKKFAILMTDGEYNTYTGKTGQEVNSNKAAVDTCAEMKTNDIVVYTIGFKLTEASAIATMNSCASGASRAYLAEDGDALKAAFNDIAQQIMTLRLTQ